jgi:hypothetical protein
LPDEGEEDYYSDVVVVSRDDRDRVNYLKPNFIKKRIPLLQISFRVKGGREVSMEIFLEILLVLINHFSGKELDWLLGKI